jgi:hypothetical protein
MELSLRLRFYLRRSLGGDTVDTTGGFPVKIVEALAPQSHRSITQKYPQYHMRTCSAHRQVIGSSHLLNGGLMGYYRGKIPRVLWVTGYDTKF